MRAYLPLLSLIVAIVFLTSHVYSVSAIGTEELAFTNPSFEPVNVTDENWTTIEDCKEKLVVELGQFAVTEHCQKEKETLVFVEVVHAEMLKTDTEVKYRLVIGAKSGAVVCKYEAMVSVTAVKQVKELIYFKIIKE